MGMTNAKRTSILLLVAIGVLVLVFLPIEIPRSIDMQGRIVPAREWLLVKDATGRIMTLMNDRSRGVTQSFDLNQFEREDAVQVRLASFVQPGASVRAGDTVGVISSSDTERLLAQLQGELDAATAALDVMRTGEKAALVKEAEERLEYARRQLEGHVATVERMRSLRDRGIISSQEFEPIETTGRLHQASLAMAEAQLQTVTTGAKASEIHLGTKNISSLEKQIVALGQKLERYLLCIPFDGVIYTTSTSDTLVLAGESSSYAVVFPVLWKDHRSLKSGMTLSVRVNGVGEIQGRVASINQFVHSIQGEQFVVATVLLPPSGLLPGLQATCSVPQEPLVLRSYLGNVFRNMFSSAAP